MLHVFPISLRNEILNETFFVYYQPQIRLIMKTKLSTTSLVIATLLYACGPSAEQKAAMQKMHDDSVKAATLAQARRQAALAQARADSAKAAQAMLAKLQQELIDTKARLDAANDEMSNIRGFHIGRTQSERDAQIEQQSKYIQELTQQADELQKKINSMQ